MSTKPEPDITIKINGQKIPINEFVKTVTSNVIDGLIDSLKLDEAPRTIEIELKR
ncbi:hypothetical protein JW960_28735 [candidate division KSB1 bacterium]|nr:hypothetical protein [candidate division KSB1 bacterium]